MIHRDRDEPRAEILFHLPHEIADERLQVRELRTVRRRHDEPKLMAITFTEFAAGELRERIARYLQEILWGACRRNCGSHFRMDRHASEVERCRKREALRRLTCTTIHGFYHVLLRIYGIPPVAAALRDRRVCESREYS